MSGEHPGQQGECDSRQDTDREASSVGSPRSWTEDHHQRGSDSDQREPPPLGTNRFAVGKAAEEIVEQELPPQSDEVDARIHRPVGRGESSDLLGGPGSLAEDPGRERKERISGPAGISEKPGKAGEDPDARGGGGDREPSAPRNRHRRDRRERQNHQDSRRCLGQHRCSEQNSQQRTDPDVSSPRRSGTDGVQDDRPRGGGEQDDQTFVVGE